MNPDKRELSFRAEFRAWALGEARLQEAATSGELDQEIDAQASEQAAAWQAYGHDPQSQGIIAHAATTLAAFLAVTKRGISDETARNAIITAMSKWILDNAEAYTQARLGIDPADPDSAFAQARENFFKRGNERFGDHFRYEQEVADETRSFVNITRCLYNDLLRDAGHPEVIPVFCAMDTVWASDATRPAYHMAFERPTTLAAGDDKCRFQFFRTDTVEGQ